MIYHHAPYYFYSFISECLWQWSYNTAVLVLDFIHRLISKSLKNLNTLKSLRFEGRIFLHLRHKKGEGSLDWI